MPEIPGFGACPGLVHATVSRHTEREDEIKQKERMIFLNIDCKVSDQEVGWLIFNLLPMSLEGKERGHL